VLGQECAGPPSQRETDGVAGAGPRHDGGLHLNRCGYILITTATPFEGREVVRACTMITEGILEYRFEPTTVISRLAASGATGTWLAMTLMKALNAWDMSTMT
jgi:hypothetical protein